ncbi:C-C motif chemokine 18-like [Thunnus maccoyii]|uniref:C-C motif chemokine 18-like n=1 Tax=Thunnus maccoyii TaxID=8240 RepID=UPI001C4B0E20|nr:C-C motif chemokine 18-like [Thunnus maccoyii]
MKTLAAFILLTLICFVHHSSAANGAVFATSDGYCMGHTQMKIPKQKVKHVMENPSHCTTKAIIVTSVCDRQYCIDPNFRWAKRLLAEFEKVPDKTSPPAPFNSSKCEKEI